MYACVKHSLIRTRVSRAEGLHFSAFHIIITGMVMGGSAL